MWKLTGLMLATLLLTSAARAQDVPGIEICTVERTMERRTSCLQSNVDFLKGLNTKLGAESQQKLDAANRQIDALKAAVATLQMSLQAQQKAIEQLQKDSKPKEAAK